MKQKDNGCPCHGCGERELHCHGKCRRYGEWKAGMEAARIARREYMENVEFCRNENWIRKVQKFNARKNRLHRLTTKD